MKNPERMTMAILVLISFAIWELALRPLIASAPAHAEGQKKAEYSFRLGRGDDLPGLKKTLDEASAGGWHAVGITEVHTTSGQYVAVLMER